MTPTIGLGTVLPIGKVVEIRTGDVVVLHKGKRLPVSFSACETMVKELK